MVGSTPVTRSLLVARQRTARGGVLRAGLLLLLVLLFGAAPAAQAAYREPARADQAMVATAHPLATAAGVEMLQAGGSAADAAVAVGFALSVVEPWSSGIGGGGFLVLHMGETTETWDFREQAPERASRDMYVRDGHVVEGESTWSARAAAIPGLVRGLVAIHRAHGKLSLAAVLAPAIRLAREGFPASERLSEAVAGSLSRMNDAGKSVFAPAGAPVRSGALFKQPDLARTLVAIAESAGEDFYTGATARELVRAVNAEGGIWSLEDLRDYKVERRDPVRGAYRGLDVVSMGPPSSGGLLLVQMLRVLEGFDVAAWGFGSAEHAHRMAEIMKRAFAMRATGLGDPDHVRVDRESFIGDAAIARLSREVKRARRATRANAIGKVKVRPAERTHTTHFSILLANGDGIACTQTINLRFGSGRVAGSTGVVLNNEMDDFSASPGAPNAFGLVGDEANAIAPKKRPLSSMTPTLLLRDGRAVGAFGSPGGSFIITTTLQSIVNIVDFQMDASEAVGAPRVHHQWYPDQLVWERLGLSPDTQRALEARGHTLRELGGMGNAMAVWRRPDGTLEGAADPRGEGSAAGVSAP
jgi:gamma-glutamyltranspeptidase/glutathione hydrolase